MTSKETLTPTPKALSREERIRAENERALAEAKARREAYDNAADAVEGEEGGPNRLEPTRFGDWEKKGIVSDF